MRLRVVIAHNYYQQSGGEDQVFLSEAALLESHGHDVLRYTVHNDRVRGMGRAALAMATIWNRQRRRELTDLIRRHRADVVHFHNTFPLISPAAYSAARDAGAAVVQTLHNFRLLCVNPLLLRSGQICEICVGKAIPWPGVVHACYRGSRAASAVVAILTSAHRALGTWANKVDRYIAPSEFARSKLIEGGLPAEKIITKYNFVHPDPAIGAGQGGFAVFVGRLSPEKGLHTLLKAWSQLKHTIPLKIVGEGPLATLVHEAVRAGGVEWLGQRSPAEVQEIISQAAMLVLPSECYETFGRVIVEAFAVGTPAIASRLGPLPNLVGHGRTGLLFSPGDSDDLIAQVRAMLADPQRLTDMRCQARAEFEAHYTGTGNYEQLMTIYEQAVCARGMLRHPPSDPAKATL